MKKETLQDAFGFIGDDLVNKASDKKKKISYVKRWVSSVAAVLVIILAVTFILNPWQGGIIVASGNILAEAEYPEMEEFPDYNDFGNWESYEKAYEAWEKDKGRQKNQYEGYNEGLENFFKTTVKEFLSSEENKNLAYSPLNVYFALGMLCETTDGNSREELLNLLGYSDINALRKQAKAIWNANYSADGMTTSILGSSIWLPGGFAVDEDCINNLKNNYFASSYQGTMGSDELNTLFKNWLNEQTGGMLSDAVEDMELNEYTLMAIATTVYFRYRWQDSFGKHSTVTEIFHTNEGDVEADFMKGWKYGQFFVGDKFSAVKKEFVGEGGMWFILPDENVSVNELLSDDNALTFISNDGEGFENKEILINLSVPKFDITSKLELIEGLKNLGVNEVFERDADFSALTKEETPMHVTNISHDARVKIDEEGVEAAAITVITADGGALLPDDEVDFVLDRPFIFVITGADGLPLFVGVINNPAA